MLHTGNLVRSHTVNSYREHWLEHYCMLCALLFCCLYWERDHAIHEWLWLCEFEWLYIRVFEMLLLENRCMFRVPYRKRSAFVSRVESRRRRWRRCGRCVTDRRPLTAPTIKHFVCRGFRQMRTGDTTQTKPPFSVSLSVCRYLCLCLCLSVSVSPSLSVSICLCISLLSLSITNLTPLPSSVCLSLSRSPWLPLLLLLCPLRASCFRLLLLWLRLYPWSLISYICC